MSPEPIILTQKLSQAPTRIDLPLPLTAEERQKARQRIELETGEVIHFQLPRGSHIHTGEYFQNAEGTVTVQAIAKPEAVITVRSSDPLKLLKAAYHLGNRHVPLEVTLEYLRFSPDHVLEAMVEGFGVELETETAPFFPETGAYGGHHHH